MPYLLCLYHDRRYPAVRKLSFTGSTEVGRVLLAEAAENVVSSSMESGGNAPFVMLPGADAAVDGALLAKMRNGGSACTAANRFYVHRGLYGEFAAKLAGALLEAEKHGLGILTMRGPTPGTVQRWIQLVNPANTFGYTPALIQFVLSNPLVDAALAGMRDAGLVRRNVAIVNDTGGRISLDALRERYV